VYPAGVVYVPFPFTGTVSVSTTGPPLATNVNVIEPVGELPPDRVAESFNFGDPDPIVAAVGFGVVVRVGLAGLTTTCSLGSLLSATSALFESPE
jgi:hypothetical protein